jgi:hypothetical protein
MVVMAPEKNRTDERLDDLARRMDNGFRERRAETVEVRKEIGEVREGLGEVKAEIKGINRTMRVGFGLIGAVLTGILGLIAAQL